MPPRRIEPVNVYRRAGAGWLSNGTWDSGTEGAPFVVNGNIQPESGEVSEVLPEGVRRTARWALYARSGEPQILATKPGFIGDRVEYAGESFFVFEVGDHVDDAPIRHREYILYKPALVASLDDQEPPKEPHESGLQAWVKSALDEWSSENPGGAEVQVIFENEVTEDGQSPPAPTSTYGSIQVVSLFRQSQLPWAQTSNTAGTSPDTVVRTVLNRYRGVVRVQLHGSRHRILRTALVDSLSRPMTRRNLQVAGLSVIAPNPLDDRSFGSGTAIIGRSALDFEFTFTKVDDHDQHPINRLGIIGRDEVEGEIIDVTPPP